MVRRAMALCSLGLAGCLGFAADGGDGDDPGPISIVSVSPADGATDVDPTASLAVELSAPTDDTDVSLAAIDGAAIAGEIGREGVGVTLTPASLLDLDHEFAASATAPAGAVDWTFSTRPGAIESAVDVAPGSATRAVAINGRGEMAATWLVSGVVSATVAGSEPTELGAASSAPAILFDSSGAAHVFAITTDGELSVWRYRAETGWDGPRLIAPASRFAPALGPDGTPIVVSAIGAAVSISRLEVGDWTVPVTLATEAPIGGALAAAVGTSGEVAAVWLELIDADMGATDVVTSTIVPGGTWSAATRLEGDPAESSGSPAIAATDDGFVSVWREPGGLVSSIKRSPSWALSSPIAGAAVGQRPVLVAEGAGLALVWADGATSMVARLADDGGWTAAEAIATSDMSIDVLSAAADRLGRLFVLQGEAALLVGSNRISLYRVTGGVEPILELEDPESAAAALAVAPHGEAVLLYEDGPLRAARYR